MIIVRNGEAFLGEAIDSVLAQSLDDYELMIVDDGSTDRTAEVAEGRRTRAPDKLRLLQHPDGGNHGMSASRNLGLVHARGEYLAFLDADDVWLPGKLADQLAILRAHPRVGLVYGRARIWRSWNGAGEDFFYDLGVPADQVQPPPALFLKQLQNRDQTPTTSGAMMRTALARSVGGFEPQFRAMFEDQVFFAKLLLRTSTYVSGATWFNYRQHPASASALSAADGADDTARLRYLTWLAGYLRKTGGALRARRAVDVLIRELRRPQAGVRVERRGGELLRLWPRFR